MIAQSVADILGRHVRLAVEGIDRMYLNIYVPQLQSERGVVRFFREHRGQPLPSAALMSPMSRHFVAKLERFVAEHEIPLVQFRKGQRKDTVMAEYLGKFHQQEGVVFVGRAQEKTPVFRTEKRRSPVTGLPYPWIVRSTAMVNHYYVYAVDRDFGPFFLKFCTYFPFNAKLCLNGHEYAKQQLARKGIAFEALDNGILSCADPARLQQICDGLSADKIDGLLRKWLRLLPHPFTGADRAAGYRYDISILQAEFSLTQMLDKPVSGRVFFEQVIRDNLDIGRPDRVSLIFDRQLRRRGPRATPGRFRTRVITAGVTPSLHVDYKHTTIKQYHKEGKALRTETTINDTRDFRIGKRLTNLPALREIGFSANRRLLCVQQLGHDPITGTDALAAITATLTTATGARIPGLRFADRRTHALLSALLIFRCHLHGFTNKDLRAYTAELRGLDPGTVTAGQMTYDLRRLKTRNLITRIEGTHRYLVTNHGLDTAKFLTCVQDRVLRCGLAELATAPTTPSGLRSAATAYRTAVENLTTAA
jgi:hypothetical protein